LWVKNLGVRKFCAATDLYGTSDLDMGAPEMFLSRRVNREIDSMREPFLAVVQTSNVHYPYYVVRNGPKPFQPASLDKSPDKNLVFRNFYQNAVYQEDQHLADIIRHLRSTDAGKRTVIVYTSDHAEAFREHYQMGHTFSTYDEEVHVPAWIDAPEGTLTPDEQHALETKAHEYLFHVDFTPTILDLMGVLDAPEIARYKAIMPGHSLLRPALTTEPLAMTNCAGVWSCAFENWGYMQRNMKITARGWDSDWKCFDVAADPHEAHDLGSAACGELPRLAIQTFGRLPGREHELKK
jgi:arylsulfatase A-like enzyme